MKKTKKFLNAFDDNNQSENNYEEHGTKLHSDYLKTHVVEEKPGFFKRMLIWGFYLFFIVIAVGVFFMFRADKYEFYLVKDEVYISNGSSYQIELLPKNARYFDYLNYSYETENADVATVDEYGTITAVGPGRTVLDISLRPGFVTKKMVINIDNTEINQIDLVVSDAKDSNKSNKEIKMKPNQSVTLKATANNNEKSNVSVKYYSSNPSVATVDDFGNVSTKSDGVAVISGEREGIVGTTTIIVGNGNNNTSGSTPAPYVTPGITHGTVSPMPYIRVTPNAHTATPKPSTVTQKPATATPKPSTATTKPATATPKPSTVTPRPSTATPKPSSSGKVTDVSFSSSQITKYVDSSITLSPTILPSTVTPKSIKWSSSNTSVATVNQKGLVKTLKKGTAIITVEVDGIKATCTVVVREKSTTTTATATPKPSTATPKPATSAPATATPKPATAPAGKQISASEVKLSKTSITLTEGKSDTFVITVSNAAGSIKVSSSNTSVVKVELASSDSNCNGLLCFFDEDKKEYKVTGVGKGEAYINISLDDVTSYDMNAVTGSGKIGVLVK